MIIIHIKTLNFKCIESKFMSIETNLKEFQRQTNNV